MSAPLDPSTAPFSVPAPGPTPPVLVEGQRPRHEGPEAPRPPAPRAPARPAARPRTGRSSSPPLPESAARRAPSLRRTARMRRTCSRRAGASSRAASSRSFTRTRKRAGSLQVPRYKVENAITVLTGCQSGVDAGEDPGRRDVDPGVHDDHVGPHLAAQGVDLVPPGEAEGRPPEQEVGHVGPQAAGQGVEAGRPEPQSSTAGRGRGGRRPRCCGPPRAPRRPGCASGSRSRPRPTRGRRRAGPRAARAARFVAVRGHERVVAAHGDAAGARAQDDVVVEVDRLEERAQLVVAVVAEAEDLEAEVDLGVGAEANGPASRVGHRPSGLPAAGGPRRRRPSGSRRAGAGRRRPRPARAPASASSTVATSRVPSASSASTRRGSVSPQRAR